MVHGLHDHMTAYEDMAMFMMKHHDIVMLGYDQGNNLFHFMVTVF